MILYMVISHQWFSIFSVHVGKRSIKEEWFSSQFRERRRPVPINNDNCRKIQHSVLFVLDTSGSIGSQSFKRMTAAVSNLIPLFCQPVQFALMTFNRRRWLEFCFNCFDNTFPGRTAAKQAIANIAYRTVGSGATYTGTATKCVCQELLSYSKCGLCKSSRIDIVFITDGYSNGPLDVCEEVKCIHRQRELRDINTYAIGIRNYRESEIRCIANYTNTETVFRFENFEEFQVYMNNVTTRLNAGNLAKYNCTTMRLNP